MHVRMQLCKTSRSVSLQLSHQDVDGVTEKLAMCKAFFYSSQLDAECIKNGISNLLAGYPILAGRLGRTAKAGQPCVWLSNAGVQFRHLCSSAHSKSFAATKLNESNRNALSQICLSGLR